MQNRNRFHISERSLTTPHTHACASVAASSDGSDLTGALPAAVVSASVATWRPLEHEALRALMGALQGAELVGEIAQVETHERLQ